VCSLTIGDIFPRRRGYVVQVGSTSESGGKSFLSLGRARPDQAARGQPQNRLAASNLA
jgi:hypothetical protein